jgi:subtilisin family serine protease
VQVKRGAGAEAKAAGGSPIARELRIWRVPDSAVPALRAEGVVVTVERERVLHAAAAALDEPLAPEEWWRNAIGADTVTAPGPGKPVTVVDTGLDVTHEEFASRPDTTLLNEQTVFFSDDDHGTEVSSVIAAPVNGVGLAGVYPQAALRSWDASPFGFITTGDAIRGIIEAARRSTGVINLSFGGEDDEPLVHEAVLYAFKHGSLVVASSGNDGLADNPLTYPASYPHVLTVGATASSGFVAGFSSRSRFVDLAAPGAQIPVAEPTLAEPTGYDIASGTSFSAPLVSGAAAWVWTARPQLDNTQLFDVMRLSAHDIDAPGFDDASGNGLLNIPSALSFRAPARDPLEPNENIDEIAPKGVFNEGQKAIVTPTRRTATVSARLDRNEDPNDVYRVFVPGRGSLSATARGAGVELRVYRAGARSISMRPLARGTTHVTARNASRSGGYMYVDVRPTTARPAYVLRVTASVRP